MFLFLLDVLGEELFSLLNIITEINNQRLQKVFPYGPVVLLIQLLNLIEEQFLTLDGRVASMESGLMRKYVWAGELFEEDDSCDFLLGFLHLEAFCW